MLKINKLVDYSVLLLSRLALDTSVSWSASRLAEQLGLNQPTLAKICRLLSKAGILRASRGVQGGYVLCQSPEAISLHAVMTAIDGESHLVSCVNPSNECPCIMRCHLQSVWQQVDHEMEQILKRKTIADFARQQRGSCCAKPVQEVVMT